MLTATNLKSRCSPFWNPCKLQQVSIKPSYLILWMDLREWEALWCPLLRASGQHNSKNRFIRCSQIQTSTSFQLFMHPFCSITPTLVCTLRYFWLFLGGMHFSELSTKQRHTTPFILAWEFSFHSVSFYSFVVHTVLPAVLLFSWMLWEIIESTVYGAVCCSAPTSSCLVNTVSLKPPL